MLAILRMNENNNLIKDRLAHDHHGA